MLIFFDYCAILENSSTATLNKGTMLLRICKEKKKKPVFYLPKCRRKLPLIGKS
jgi:hypothetical protein